MDGLTAVLGVLAVAGSVATVAFAVARGRAAARCAAAEAALRGAEGEAGRLRGELDRAEGEREEARRRLGEAQVESAQERERLESQRRAHAADLARAEELHEERLRAAERVHRERVEAEERARRELERRMAELNDKFEKTFGSLAARALQDSSEQFLKLAEQTLSARARQAEAEMDKRREAVDQLVRPIAETLRKTDEKLAAIEKERTGAYASLAEQIRSINTANEMLRGETSKLVRALSKPEVRGRYGEIQLRRVAELAGMTAYCDFTEQSSTRGADGRLLRPDMVVRLPNDRLIAVDAKTNTQAYIDACEAASDGERAECLERFARHVAEQVTALARKGYWAELDGRAGALDFVVMFVPGDQFLDAALGRRPDLLELAAQHGVILASPATLIGLLRAVAVGWREKSVADQAAALLKLGGELRDRAATLYTHMSRLGGAIEAAVSRYNEVVGSYETRLTPTLRRFEEAGIKGAKEIPELGQVTVKPRRAQAVLDGVAGGEGNGDGIVARG